jgi:hypothetical protein
MELDAGFIVPSTLAALNLMGSAIQPASDVLFLKIAPESITTAVFQDRRLQFYRRVASEPLYDAVYPTVLYYQDKLGGKAIERMVFCGYDEDTMAPLGELQQKLGVPAHRLGPRNIEDIFKPALGAVHFSWASST